MAKICVLGAGSWGTAIAQLLAENNHTVALWCYEKEIADHILLHNINPYYMSEYRLSPLIYSTHDISEACSGADYIFEAIPVQFLRSVLRCFKQGRLPDCPWVVLSKGIERKTLFLSSNIIHDELGKHIEIAICAGPTYAQDVMKKSLMGFVIATENQRLFTNLYSLMARNYCMVHFSYDVIGVQVASALKNIIALVIGALDKIDVTDSTKALIATQGLLEMSYLIDIWGGRTETAYSLAGVGDLILTSFGKLSKNNKAGKLLAEGASLEEVATQFSAFPEGLNSALTCEELFERHADKLPFFKQIAAFVKGRITIFSLIDSFTLTHTKSFLQCSMLNV